MSVISFQRFVVPVYYWKTVEIMITGVNYYENGSNTDNMIYTYIEKNENQAVNAY
jgi:hypothetical protein